MVLLILTVDSDEDGDDEMPMTDERHQRMLRHVADTRHRTVSSVFISFIELIN